VIICPPCQVDLGKIFFPRLERDQRRRALWELVALGLTVLFVSGTVIVGIIFLNRRKLDERQSIANHHAPAMFHVDAVCANQAGRGAGWRQRGQRLRRQFAGQNLRGRGLARPAQSAGHRTSTNNKRAFWPCWCWHYRWKHRRTTWCFRLMKSWPRPHRLAQRRLRLIDFSDGIKLLPAS